MLLETWEKVAILAGVVLSVGLFSFFLSWFAFKKMFPDNSHKRTKLLSWLTTVIFTPAILYLIAYLVFTPEFPDLNDSIDGWEVRTTFQVYPSKTVSIVGKRFEINSGESNVLIVSRELIPVVKLGQTEPTDLRSTRNLIIELSQTDTLVIQTNLARLRSLGKF